MPAKSTEQKPSKTASFTTLTRALAHKEFNDGELGRDCFAAVFLPFHLKLLLKAKQFRTKLKHKNPRGMYEYMLARTAYFDAVFEDAMKKNVPQIVLLGAGYDTRAYRFAHAIKDTAIASFLAQRKLEAADHLDSREMEKRFLANKDGLSNSRVTGWFRIVKVKKQG